MKFKEWLEKLLAGEDLDSATMGELMRAVMSGRLSDAQIAALLIALRQKGETPSEIAAAAGIMREYAEVVDTGVCGLVDTCGTGGDNASTFNISTAAAVVAAAAGVKIAKHGNRSVSGKSGSADFLEAAGVRVDLDAGRVAQCIREIGIGFLFAPKFHQAMKHVAGPRKDIGVRTIFNLLGPLSNPAAAEIQLIGVFSSEWLVPFADAAARLGITRAMVVHSEDGLDEISIHAPTQVAELKNGEIKRYRLVPSDFGLEEMPLDAIRIESVAQSLEIVHRIFEGGSGHGGTDAAHDIVVINAAAAIYLSELTSDFAEAAQAARLAIQTGAARDKLEQLARLTTQLSQSS